MSAISLQLPSNRRKGAMSTGVAHAASEPSADQRDELAGTRNAAASQRDVDAKLRDHVAVFRDGTALDQDQAAAERDQNALDRDDSATKRDCNAEGRDRSAAQRDRDAEQLEGFTIQTVVLSGGTSIAEAIPRAAASQRRLAQHDRESAAAERGAADRDRHAAASDRAASSKDRANSAADRSRSLADRGAAQGDRDNASRDRVSSLAERQASQLERRAASFDSLTGGYLRGPGLVQLERDIARAVRNGLPFTLAFADIDRLKDVNDLGGHAAGDRLLIAVAQTLSANLRPYDLVIRIGGDEFVCGLIGLSLADVDIRMAAVNTDLAARPEHGSLTVGLAELKPDDSLSSLIERADAALYNERHRRAGHKQAASAAKCVGSYRANKVRSSGTSPC